jgi:ABC-2 type transport system permease protein
MRLLVLHARIALVELLRYPAFVVPTVLFPSFFFLVFAAGGRGPVATYAMCSFAAFAVIGVAFFQFGVGIASERETPWERYVRTLPVGAGVRLGARLLAAAAFAAAAGVLVIAAALASTDASLTPLRWLELASVLVLGLVPFGLLGIALGYWAPARAALPIANLLYLGLSFGGGLWIRPSRLPHAVAQVSTYLPTRRLANALLGVVRGSPWHARDWLALLGFSLFFAVAAIVGYRRDEGQRFR